MALRIPAADTGGQPGIPARIAYLCPCKPETTITVEAGWDQSKLLCPFCTEPLEPRCPPCIPSKFDRARQKRESREWDAYMLSTGMKTKEQLRDENSHFARLNVKRIGGRLA
jgi:hypothetical protein